MIVFCVLYMFIYTRVEIQCRQLYVSNCRHVHVHVCGDRQLKNEIIAESMCTLYFFVAGQNSKAAAVGERNSTTEPGEDIYAHTCTCIYMYL